jgi:hypothetical protein
VKYALAVIYVSRTSSIARESSLERYSKVVKRISRFHAIPFVLGLAAALPAPLAAQGACQPVFDAMTKVVTTSAHIYNTSTGARPRSSETIYAAGSIYVNFAGKWTRSPLTPPQMLKQEEENRQHSKYSCRYLRDESVNGEPAALYSAHAETQDSKSDSQIWISRSKGLPLRQELDIDIGDKAGKNHYSVRYEYADVKPPL